MSRKWMPLYVSDYLGDTAHLSTLEHGAYLLLMMHYWNHGELPQCDRRLARITRLREEDWHEVKETLAEFFEDGWRHGRIEAELEKTEDLLEKRRAASAAGVEARRRKAAPPRAQPHGQPHGQPSVAREGDHRLTQPQPQPHSNPPVDANASTAPQGADDGPEPSSDGAVLEAAQPACGKEPKAKATERGTRLSEDWEPRPKEVEFAQEHGFTEQEIENAADEFRDYWLAIPGQRGRKTDWDRTFRNRLRELAGRRQRPAHGGNPSQGRSGSGGVVASASRVLSQIRHH